TYENETAVSLPKSGHNHDFLEQHHRGSRDGQRKRLKPVRPQRAARSGRNSGPRRPTFFSQRKPALGSSSEHPHGNTGAAGLYGNAAASDATARSHALN